MNNQKVSASSSQTAEELVQKARGLMQQQDLDGAWQCLENSLEIAKTADAYRNLGNILHLRGQAQQAVSCFQKALQVDEKDHASLAMLAETHRALGELEKALHFSAEAIALAPAEIRYKERFITISENASLQAYDMVIENTILVCLQTPGLDCAGLQGLWYNTFTLIPSLQRLYGLKTASGGGFFARLKNSLRPAGGGLADVAFDPAPFNAAKNMDALSRPFFLLGLEALVVYSLPFEAFLSHLRKSLLTEPQRYAPKARLQIAAALSHYCLNTEYILDVTEEEEKQVAALQDDAEGTAIRACYAPLSQLPDAQALAEKHANVAELRGVIEAQVVQRLTYQKARTDIPAITAINEGTSAEVRAQYEESPYPQWLNVPRDLKLQTLALGLKAPGTKILVAGCGTGLEAAQMASVLPEAEILAVDLSLSSLAYAKTRTEALGFKNITFRQADILNLGSLEERFDGIVSGGVLHHLKEPLKGWQTLTGLLKDGGLMRIGLYSKIARRHIAAAQKAILQAGYPATPEGMRRFRKESRALLAPDTYAAVTQASDYYHMSMLRDLLFHVQEHCFDIPELAEALKGLNLEFLNFILQPSVTGRYLAAFPNDAEGISLENWHKFEQDNPDTFIGMYQFWCRKK